MIKGRLMRGETSILLLGLTKENIKRLQLDQPIRISGKELAEMGLPDIEVLIIAGDTEASISKQLGGLPLQPEVAGQSFTQMPHRRPGESGVQGKGSLW